MPLKSGSSQATISHNIDVERRAHPSMDPKQAAAIAYSRARGDAGEATVEETSMGSRDFFVVVVDGKWVDQFYAAPGERDKTRRKAEKKAAEINKSRKDMGQIVDVKQTETKWLASVKSPLGIKVFEIPRSRAADWSDVRTEVDKMVASNIHWRDDAVEYGETLHLYGDKTIPVSMDGKRIGAIDISGSRAAGMAMKYVFRDGDGQRLFQGKNLGEVKAFINTKYAKTDANVSGIPSRFKEGDRVRVIANGNEGPVVKVSDGNVEVKLSSIQGFTQTKSFTEKELTRADAAGRKYYTLLDQSGHIQFGDYSRTVVKQELEDMAESEGVARSKFKIVESGDSQKEINEAVVRAGGHAFGRTDAGDDRNKIDPALRRRFQDASRAAERAEEAYRQSRTAANKDKRDRLVAEAEKVGKEFMKASMKNDADFFKNPKEYAKELKAAGLDMNIPDASVLRHAKREFPSAPESFWRDVEAEMKKMARSDATNRYTVHWTATWKGETGSDITYIFSTDEKSAKQGVLDKVRRDFPGAVVRITKVEEGHGAMGGLKVDAARGFARRDAKPASLDDCAGAMDALIGAVADVSRKVDAMEKKDDFVIGHAVMATNPKTGRMERGEIVGFDGARDEKVIIEFKDGSEATIREGMVKKI